MLLSCKITCFLKWFLSNTLALAAVVVLRWWTWYSNGHRCSFGTLFITALHMTQQVRTKTRTFWFRKSSSIIPSDISHFVRQSVKEKKMRWTYLKLSTFFLSGFPDPNTHTVLVSFLQNAAIASMHIPPLPLHPLVSSYQTQVQKLLSSGSHMASDVPETLHGVWVQNKDSIGLRWEAGRPWRVYMDSHRKPKASSKSVQVTVSG